MKAWTAPYMAWVRQVHFTQLAREATMLDYLYEVDHMGERVKRLEQSITEAVKLATPAVQEVVKGLQALRGIAEISAVTIVAELGSITRFENARQLMGYSGAVPSEDSSGQRTRRGALQKRATRISGASLLKRPGVIGTGQPSAPGCANDKKECRNPSRRSLGRHRSGSRNAMPGWRRQARTSARSSPPWGANCWASSGPSASKRKLPANCDWQPDKMQEQKTKAKAKTSQRVKKQKPDQ